MKLKRDTLEKILLILKITILFKTILAIFIGGYLLCKNYVYTVNDKNVLKDVTIDSVLVKTKKRSVKKVKQYGVDIAKYHLKSIEEITPLDSISFVYIKATDGITYINPKFEKECKVATEIRIVSGAYHFFRNNDDPIEQAQFFYTKVALFYKTSPLPLVIDVEEEGISRYPYDKNLQENVLIFLNHLETLTGKTPMVYTNYCFGEKYLTDTFFKNYPLWIADYTSKTVPRVPSAWEKRGWALWQKTNHYKTQTDWDIAKSIYFLPKP